MTSLAIRASSRSLLGRALDTASFTAVLGMLEAIDEGRSDVFGVLTYHRVAPDHGLTGYPGLVSATPAGFAEQMEHIARRHPVIGLADLLAAREGASLPRRAVLVTFDDAYRDFAEHAWPVLRRLGLPTTLFVPTAFADEPTRAFWWDRLYDALARTAHMPVIELPSVGLRVDTAGNPSAAFRRLRSELKALPHADLLDAVDSIVAQLGRSEPAGQVLGWSELQSLAAEGVTLAAHTRTHPLLPRVAPSDLDAELSGSLADLERRVGSTPRALAYPSGAYTEDVRAAARRAGFDLAFTTRRGLNRAGRTDWLQLRRVNVGRATSLNALRAQLGRWALAWSA